MMVQYLSISCRRAFILMLTFSIVLADGREEDSGGGRGEDGGKGYLLP